MFPYRRRIIWCCVNLIFPDADTERLFSTKVLLERRFGAPISARIMMRLSVLGAAPRLSSIPRRSPFGLRQNGDELLIDLVLGWCLRVQPLEPPPWDFAKIDSLLVLGLADHPEGVK